MGWKGKCLDNREEKAKAKTKRNSKSGINIENCIAFPWVMGDTLVCLHIMKEKDG